MHRTMKIKLAAGWAYGAPIVLLARLDEARLARVLAERGSQDVDRGLPHRLADELVPPHLIEQGVLREQRRRVPCEHAQRGERLGRQRDRLVITQQRRVRLVQLEPIDADLDRIGGGLSDGSLDLASLYVACLTRKRDVVDQAAAALSVQAPLLAFVLEIPLKTSLERLSSSLPPERFDGWKEGYCPVCGSRAGMAELSGDEGKRRLSCSACFFRWPYPRIQCPYCGNADPETLSYFTAGDGPTRVGVCRKCSRYLKTHDVRLGNADVPLEAEDLATLHLDLLAGKEGFERGK